MPETPVSSDIRPPVGSSKSADKMPFSDKELSRIMRACDNPLTLIRSGGQVNYAV
jgi:hypothetical protein